MTGRLIILMFFLLLLRGNCFPQARSEDTRLREIVRQHGQADVSIPYPGTGAIDHISRNVSIASVKDKNVFIVLSPVTVEWFIAGGFDYTIYEREAAKGSLNAISTAMAMGWESYPTWPQYDSIMKYFSDNYPSLCNLDTIGTSIKGRYVFALKISDNAGTDEDEPEVFFTSTMHGNETSGFILMLRFADYLLQNYENDGRIRSLVDNLEIWINPLANPDGTYSEGNLITWPTRFNSFGYDLNRNFPDPVSAEPAVQKETTDMVNFMKNHRFVLSANFHSGIELVNYPWDRWQRYHADNDWFYRISRNYADTVHLYSEPGYMTDMENGITNGYEWYQAYGTRQDYVTWELQGREVTIELHNSYLTPADQLAAIWESNRRSLVGFLENALSGIHGYVSDYHSGMPVAASVVIRYHDEDNSEVTSDIISGRFVRLIEPGTWDLTFSAEGYRDTVVSVITTTGEITELSVEMSSAINRVDTTNHVSPFLYPNPASTYIKAVLPEELKGELWIGIYSVSGKKVAEYSTAVAGIIPLRIDISALKRGMYIIKFTNRISGISGRASFIIARHP